MLRMELLEHGCYATAGNRLVASGAQRPTFGVIVCLAIRLALVVEELATHEWHTAVLQRYTQTPVRHNNMQKDNIPSDHTKSVHRKWGFIDIYEGLRGFKRGERSLLRRFWPDRSESILTIRNFWKSLFAVQYLFYNLVNALGINTGFRATCTTIRIIYIGVKLTVIV